MYILEEVIQAPNRISYSLELTKLILTFLNEVMQDSNEISFFALTKARKIKNSSEHLQSRFSYFLEEEHKEISIAH